MLPSSPITTATHTAIDTLNPSLAAHVQVTLRVGHCAAAADLCHVTKVRVMGKGAKEQSLHNADMSLEQWLALWRAVGDAVAIATSCAQHARGEAWSLPSARLCSIFAVAKILTDCYCNASLPARGCRPRAPASARL